MSLQASVASPLRLCRELYWAARWNTGIRASRLGERLGIDALIYNPVVMDQFALQASQAAPLLADAVLQVWPGVRSVADIGCGPGFYVRAFTERGIAGTGYERSRYARRLAASLGVQTRGFDVRDAGNVATAELTVCLEVAEHLPAPLGDLLLDIVVRSAPRLVFSAAQPGQGGNGHVNEQPLTYWEDRLTARGCTYLRRESSFVRSRLAEATYARWLARNVMLFERDGSRGGSTADYS